MPLVFFLVLVIAIAVFGTNMLRKARGNYLLSIFQFLFAFVMVYGYAFYSAREAIAFHYGEAILPSCWLAITIGLLGILLGYTLAYNRSPPGWQHLARVTNANRLGIPGLVLSAIGVLGEIRFIQLSGGVVNYFSAGRSAGDYENVSAYIYGARWLLFPGAAFLISAGMEKRPWRWGSVVLLVVMAAYNLILGQRSGIFAVAILSFYCAMLWRRKMPRLTVVVAVGCVLAVVMGFVKVTREEFYLGSNFERAKSLINASGPQLALDLAKENFATTSDKYYISEIALFAGFLKVIPKEVDYDYFVFYKSFFYNWIPRVWWPDRPDPSASKVVELDKVLGKTHRTGSTPTILGMYYLHLGYLSVFVMAVFTGFYLGLIDSFGGRAMAYPAAAVVFVTLSNGILSMPIGLGPLASIASLLPFSVFPMLAGLWWASGADAKPSLKRQRNRGKGPKRTGYRRHGAKLPSRRAGKSPNILRSGADGGVVVSPDEARGPAIQPKAAPAQPYSGNFDLESNVGPDC